MYSQQGRKEKLFRNSGQDKGIETVSNVPRRWKSHS